MKKIVMMMFAALFAMNVLADNVKFKVTNIRCQNCAKRVEKTLKANEAVKEVSVDLQAKTVSVSYDAEKANAEALLKTLTDAKYQAEILKQCDGKKGGCGKHEGKEGGCGKHEGKQGGCGHHAQKEAEAQK
ncbi:heavy-metal-associated domain-containing protein [Prevotella sp. P6B1]|uniref:heavy-metal-associated domain-containing protein n=1 Tax=Prevotella sp. P6B1 TaxID=1410613 RepID=UPI00068DB2CF|nr:heavy-metal-associated domain-containing protein [Prevotella sp. P6B1]